MPRKCCYSLPTSRRRPRRGVLLLVVLGLLAMFGLVAVTFVVLASQHKRAALTSARIDQQYETWQQQLDQAFRQCVRGSNNAMSAVNVHSLLEDEFGNAPEVVAITTAVTFVPSSTSPIFFEIDVPSSSSSRPTPYDYVGCVLTFFSGPGTGLSTYIVGVDDQSTPPKLLAKAVDCSPPMTQWSAPSAANPYYALINSKAFAGTGYGAITGNSPPHLDQTALWPNYYRYMLGNVGQWLSGGANEDYDAPDYQNPLLAGIIPIWDSSGAGTTPIDIRIIPSLHRPDLINYWRSNGIADFSDEQRKVFLRPDQRNHPNFPGNGGSSSEIFDPVNGYLQSRGVQGMWDVDSDGDGYTDSIWVDLGMPVRTLPDGRKYKPLFAILCVDLDGRLNLNAHGSLAQTETSYYQDVSPGSELPSTAGAVQLAGTTTLPRGQGWGPADINLAPLYQDMASNGQAYYRYLFTGVPSMNLDGRYGDLMSSPPNGIPRPGFPSDDASAPVSNPLNANKWFPYCGNFWGFVDGTAGYQLDAFGAPPDFCAAGAVGLDKSGHPAYASMGKGYSVASNLDSLSSGQLNNPYKVNLSPKAAHDASHPAGSTLPDNPFGAGELERVLRQYDRDSPLLPSRLFSILGLTTADGSGRDRLWKRNLVTTESWDLPCPNVFYANQITTLLWVKLSSLSTQEKLRVMRDLLPPSILVGLKMNINAPWGNGRDDNGNGTVDEPEEAGSTTGENVPLYIKPGQIVNVPVDYFNGVQPGTDPVSGKPYTAREMYARYLYVLMSLVCDTSYLEAKLPPDDPGDSSETQQYRRAKYLAQWAANVVDFRDRDSISTRFTFVQDPFTQDGWNPSKNPDFAANKRKYLVFGCERPEMLISETSAFHDRHTEDLDTEKVDNSEGDNQDLAGKTTDTATANPTNKHDGSFDQRHKPVGALFISLYNPNGVMEPMSGEFYRDQKAGAWKNGVVLTQRTPSANPQTGQGQRTDPVWRMIVVPAESAGGNGGEQLDPDSWNPARRPTIDRSVYFVNPKSGNTGFPVTDDGFREFPDDTLATKFAAVPPGHFAVVGPGGQSPDGEGYTTRFGDSNQANPPASAFRRIILTPNTDPTVQQVRIENNNSTWPNDVQPCSAVVINQAQIDTNSVDYRRLSLTEGKKSKYTDLSADGSTPYDASKDEYKPAWDMPFDDPGNKDKYHDGDDEVMGWLQLNGTTTSPIRVVHLQRLANPYEPWDDTLNPYLTIDSMPVDLTVFNSATDTQANPEPSIGKPSKMMFHSWQRGETNDDQFQRNLWKQERMTRTVATDSSDQVSGNFFFTYKWQNSLGYLSSKSNDANFGFGPRLNAGGPAPAYSPAGSYRGEPAVDANWKYTFPWLCWNNRPFSSPLELLLVPTLRSSKLLRRNELQPYLYYSLAKDSSNQQPYDKDLTETTDIVPFRHLMDFFRSGPTASSGGSSQFHRLLDYLYVPSPFVGASTEGNAQALSDSSDLRYHFHSPQNQIPSYREPGRININTIFHPDVFRGLVNQTKYQGLTQSSQPYQDPFWRLFADSRRGDQVSTSSSADPVLPQWKSSNPFAAATGYPSLFSRPFRSASDANLVPELPSDTNKLIPAREVDVTLLRSDPRNDPQHKNQPLFGCVSTDASNNTDRNPNFRYQGLERLGNLVTTRSNVYAIWITVGYFEVESCNVDSGHPDGYRLGQEIGSDSGEVQRHRGFFIFDRSIPVGFQRGLDLNVENAILTRRYIE